MTSMKEMLKSNATTSCPTVPSAYNEISHPVTTTYVSLVSAEIVVFTCVVYAYLYDEKPRIQRIGYNRNKGASYLNCPPATEIN